MVNECQESEGMKSLLDVLRVIPLYLTLTTLGTRRAEECTGIIKLGSYYQCAEFQPFFCLLSFRSFHPTNTHTKTKANRQ